MHRSSFTLIELLIVIAIIAVIAVVVVLVVNPSEHIARARDAGKLSDLDTVVKAIAFTELRQDIPLGSSSVVYVSIPDPAATTTAGSQCQGLGLVALPTSTVYHCAASSTYRNVDGTGWIPVNFTKLSQGSPLPVLPTDPKNTSSTGDFYEYMTDGVHYEITANMDSSKYQSAEQNDGGSIPFLMERGTSQSLIEEDYGCANGGPCVWVTDAGNSRVEKFDRNGNYLAQFGSNGAGDGQFQYSLPYDGAFGLAMDSKGDLYVSDSVANRIQEFDVNGNYLMKFGSAGAGNGQFNKPYGVLVHPNGDLFVTDYGNNRVEEFSAAGAYVQQFGPPNLSGPTGITIDSSSIMYIVDATGADVQSFYSASAPYSAFKTNSSFDTPQGVAVSNGGDLYIVENSGMFVERYTLGGVFVSQWGGIGSGNGQFDTPNGVAADANGIVYIADSANNRVQFFDASGTYLGKFGSLGSGEGSLSGPNGILVK